MPDHLETLEVCVFILPDTGLLLCDPDLVFHGIHAVKVRKEKP